MNETISAKSTPSLKMTHSVQAGAFLNIEYAEEVVAQLKSKGYPAQIIMVKDSIGRSWYTVRIGDYPSKEEAQAEADAFSTLEKMETAVRPFGKL
jgi:cell division protein FtsN